MTTIFEKKDFTLCYVPVPKGYPQSQTHCGVGECNGSVILTTTPYPNIKNSKTRICLYAILKKITFGLVNMLKKGEDYENPCIYVSHKNDEKYKTKFQLVGNEPIVSKPKDLYGLGSYCSDPDLYIDGDIMRILYRTTIRKSRTGNPNEDYETTIHLIEGHLQEESFNVVSNSVLFKGHDISPSLQRYKGNLIYIALKTNSYNTGEPCEQIFYRVQNEDKSWNNAQNIKLISNMFEPWHMSLFQYDGVMYAIIACVRKGESHRCWQMLGEFSKDLSMLTIYQTPLTDYKSYRGAAYVDKTGEFLLYTSTVGENINGGESVDGREIMFAHVKFSELLSQIKNIECNE